MPSIVGPDPDLPAWDVTQTAQYLGLAVSTVRGYRRAGYLPTPDRLDGWEPKTIIRWQANRLAGK